MVSNIDFVVTWVNGNDPVWREEKKKYEVLDGRPTLNDETRYRDMDLFQYWFRAVEKYAPWVNNIYFITYGHLPEWLNINHPKLKIVKHEDYIPKEYLPTFSSNVIELNLFRIKELSEQFVLFSDDVFINTFLKEEDLFINNLPRLLSIYRPLVPTKEFDYINFNHLLIMNKYFHDKKTLSQHKGKFFNVGYGKFNLYNLFSIFYSGIIGYHDAHVAMPHLKSTFAEIWNKEGELLDQVCKNKFRSTKDVNHWLMSYWNIETNSFMPQNLSVGEYVPLAYSGKIESIIHKQKNKFLCINDDEHTENFINEVNFVRKIFDNKFPKKSQFEK